ncbi:Rrf2 family transcriptional regulator [Streptomyces qinglanensis]|uniref:Rrf2 family transcriptional regulator n=1 Tax=Streptomyces qinglanensis TaxID=943816 RepID=UPI001160191D|nr:Rrf2 family transcriptional regulator [Streptomyces qinglanensis]
MSAATGFALLAAMTALERENPGSPHRLGAIAARAGLSASQANKLLAQAAEHGLVHRTGYGRYALAGTAARAVADAAAQQARTAVATRHAPDSRWRHIPVVAAAASAVPDRRTEPPPARGLDRDPRPRPDTGHERDFHRRAGPAGPGVPAGSGVPVGPGVPAGSRAPAGAVPPAGPVAPPGAASGKGSAPDGGPPLPQLTAAQSLR